MKKLVLALTGTALLVAAAVTYTVSARHGTADAEPAAAVTLAPGQLLFRDTATGRVGTVPLGLADGKPQLSGLKCDRFAVAKQTAVCLAVRPGTLPAITDVLVLDDHLAVRHAEALPGTPSRARVSPDGKRVYWTLFVTGDSYAQTGFSTRAGLYEVETGRLVKTIEELPVFVDGKRYFSHDVNYWGITFAPDGNRFYATLGSKGRTYLVEGDYGRYRGRTLRENVECPSLSPDGKRVAFKKKVAEGVWRLAVLDLASMRETELAETRSVDDQALWQDDRTILYGLENAVWAVPADGTGTPRRLVGGAASPAVTG
ncbi:WD40-like Beta Propeller Repeat [Amycolatopsis tolypomycina]|uniref:WD40-like Beta Propeller Repeat n=1 Tax=Amycolatopsis tolypomycina TaxID=208445 RepID=A0A1H4PW97_9PSEU|nr:PD40 domain-containing protein [Amycolatopsis tolypomycina]SEC11488.1 WD40-like Beta Propeller Repeat [Amycolatopsis tolypomycina]